MKEFIKIEEIIITGIKNPFFNLKGILLKENIEFKVFYKNKQLNCDFFHLGDKNSFVITTPIPTSSGKVEVKIFENGELVETIKRSNNLIIRVLSRIKKSVNLFFKKVCLLFSVIFKALCFFWREYHFLVPPSMWIKYLKDFVKRMKEGHSNRFYKPFDSLDYNKWLVENEAFTQDESFEYNPLISILIPVYNASRLVLCECINSILKQTYTNFEICLVDDCSNNQDTISTLQEFEKQDKRIKLKFRKENGHISKATNDALQIANGEYVAFMDNDDVLAMNALMENVRSINADRNIDLLYSDEDKLDMNGKRCDPNFKPDYSPNTLMSLNYICHFVVVRKTLAIEVGGCEVGLEGAQDFDFLLKIVEKTDRIYHIPKILYHWRMIEGSTSMNINEKSYATDKGKIALENALKRRKLKGQVFKEEKSNYYHIKYEVIDNPLISIIIPTRDYADILEVCLSSIYKKTTYKNFEIIIANNGSVEENTLNLFKKYSNIYKNFFVKDINTEFNYSNINNLAVKEARGKFIVLLNNDTEVITPEWLETMVGYAQLDYVGAVGPKLLYPDSTIQHAGVIIGLGGVASHAYIGSAKEDTGMYGRLSVPYNYSAVTAACLMVEKSKFLSVGGLDENLKVAYNDIDFNLRLLEKKLYNLFLPQVELFHYESKSRGLDTTGEKYRRFLIECDQMYNKWGDSLFQDRFYNKNFSLKGWFVLDKK